MGMDLHHFLIWIQQWCPFHNRTNHIWYFLQIWKCLYVSSTVFWEEFNYNINYVIWTVFCGHTWYEHFIIFNLISTVMDSKVSFPHCMMMWAASIWNPVAKCACIMYDHNILFGLHNQCYCWILLEKWCRFMLILCMTTIYCSDYIIDVMVEFPLKNGANLYPYHVWPQYTVWIT